MFERTKTEYVPYEKTVTINENRAPTDESIKILRELEQKARDSVIDSFVVQDNKFSAVELVLSRNPLFQDIDVAISFTLNGHKHLIRTKIDEDFKDPHTVAWEKLNESLVMKCAESIAQQIVNLAIFEVVRNEENGFKITIKH